MRPNDWSREEVHAIVDDYLAMLSSELAGTPYSKAAHRRALSAKLENRSAQAIEFKHANISAVLVQIGFPSIPGYKGRSNYQGLLAAVVAEKVAALPHLLELAAVDADCPITVPEVDDILATLTSPPARDGNAGVRGAELLPTRLTTNYIEREARNQSLGMAGELFALNFERARLIHAGMPSLAHRVEHTSRVRGDGAGYDILSYEHSGEEKLIEVKTTKYGIDTPFWVSKNELAVSERLSKIYCLYRLFTFRKAPRLFQLPGAISASCELSATSFIASPR